MEGVNALPLITLFSLIAFAGGLAIVIASANHKWEAVGGVFVFLGGIGLGVTFVAAFPGLYQSIARYHLPDRVPATRGIEWKKGEATVTFPPLSEEGAEWVIITDSTEKEGEYVPATTYHSDKPIKTVKVYQHFRDGTVSIAVPVPPTHEGVSTPTASRLLPGQAEQTPNQSTPSEPNDI